MTTSQIVSIANDGEARASTEAIATGYKLQHKNVPSLLKRYTNEMEGFGLLAFETRLNNQGSPTEYALLNERQTMLLLTLMRNSVKVVAFKVQLIQEFCRLAEALQNRDMTMWDKCQKFEAKDKASKALGSHGSRLLHTRRKEKTPLDSERIQIETEMETPLFMN
jgi:phage regulator Rha-like protein